VEQTFKVLCHGSKATRKFPSGPELTPEGMVEKVKATTKDWNYDVVSIGYPGQWIQDAPQFGQLLQRSDIVSQRDRFEDEDFDRTPNCADFCSVPTRSHPQIRKQYLKI
jgi:hypothetical protein